MKKWFSHPSLSKLCQITLETPPPPFTTTSGHQESSLLAIEPPYGEEHFNRSRILIIHQHDVITTSSGWCCSSFLSSFELWEVGTYLSVPHFLVLSPSLLIPLLYFCWGPRTINYTLMHMKCMEILASQKSSGGHKQKCTFLLTFNLL